MFCPKCGKPEQQINSFCRNCGTFLPDYEKLEKKITSPEQHLAANTALNVLTGVVSLALAITLHLMFTGRADTPVIIYITTGFLTAIFFWQAQIFWRNRLLKKQLPNLGRQNKNPSVEQSPQFAAAETRELLNEADPGSIVPPNIIQNTTRKLGEKIDRKTT